MVNTWFPDISPAWFRNGGRDQNHRIHARWPASIENLRRIKSHGVCEKSARFNLNANTGALSRAGSEDFSGFKAKSRKATRSRPMFFLLRLAFWVGLVLVLLPRDKTAESDKTPQIKASEAVSAATAAVSDVGQFCKRQPAACEVGGQAATMIGQRAQAGARKLYHIITEKRPPDHTSSISTSQKADPALAEALPRETLTADDMQIEWRGTPAP
jgi:hypothetical protein